MNPSRGEVWNAALDPTEGHEQAGHRPVLIVSHDQFNQGGSRLVVALPLTRTERQHVMHVRVLAPEGGLEADSSILCDQIRTLSQSRLGRKRGRVSDTTLAAVEARLLRLLALR